jgi:deoxyribodipyrimidine photo-lyase
MTSLAVLTRDLRLDDNPSLADPATVALFVADPAIERLHGSPNRQAYLSETLTELDAELTARGSGLVYRTGAWVDTVLEAAREAAAGEIRVARDVSGLAQRRHHELLARSPVPVVAHDAITVVPPDALSTGSGGFYKVFTPFHRRWMDAPRRRISTPPDRFIGHDLPSDPIPPPPTIGVSAMREPGGRAAALDRLEAWLPKAAAYDDTRNDLALAGTSHLSAALHFGVLSALEVAIASEDVGADAFVRQLAWRDFNHHVLYHRPDAAAADFRDGDPVWNVDIDAFDAWTAGRTGFPVVDAAMRQLSETGWMHNRARMVTASFLTKDLMIDWRLGARWFMTWLTDGDVANNQLGWQWVAGTGTDTNPTRIFNPTLQSERFDPDGTYIRRWVPELRDVDSHEIHDPGPLTRSAVGYPPPIVDHHQAIRDFKAARGYR